METGHSAETDRTRQCHCSEYEHGCPLHGCDFMAEKVCRRPAALYCREWITHAAETPEGAFISEEQCGWLMPCDRHHAATAVGALIMAATLERIAERGAVTSPGEK